MGEFPKPGPEHTKLRRLTGAWAAQIKYFPAPDASPHESTGEFLSRMDIGGFFLSRDMNFGLQGYQGRGLIGYDPFQKAYVGTWVDSTSPIIYRTTGGFDARGVFCETSEGPDADGILVRTRMTTEMIEPNQMLFRMYHCGASEWLALEIAHTRRRFV
jgi:hypothetical protein